MESGAMVKLLPSPHEEENMRIGTIWGLIGCLALATGLAAWEQDAAKPSTDDVAALKTEVARLRGLVPDQSHAMADVGYHFTNLWFAGEQSNWPLAQFYSDEVRSHLRWAVRI